LRAGLDVLFRIAVIFDQTAGKDLNRLDFFWGGLDGRAAHIVEHETGLQELAGLDSFGVGIGERDFLEAHGCPLSSP
jgi:hypothetical protein